MRRALLGFGIVVVVAGGAAGCSKESAKPSPGTQQASTLTLGEATVIELIDKRGDAVTRPAWKLHADGTTEEGNDKTGKWTPGVKVSADGTFAMGPMRGRISSTEITFERSEYGEMKPIAVSGNTIAVQVWEKEHDGEDLIVKLDLAADGNVTVHHKGGPRVQYRIEAANPEVMRTAFLVFGAFVKSALD